MCEVFPRLIQLAVEPQAAEIVAQRPHVAGDGHLIIVQDNYNVLLQGTNVIQRLKSHSPSESAVAHHCNHVVIVTRQIPGDGHACRRRNGSGTVSHIEMIMFAFRPFWEPRYSLPLPQSGKLAEAACNDLVGVALVPHIPHNPITRAG